MAEEEEVIPDGWLLINFKEAIPDQRGMLDSPHVFHFRNIRSWRPTNEYLVILGHEETYFYNHDMITNFVVHRNSPEVAQRLRESRAAQSLIDWATQQKGYDG